MSISERSEIVAGLYRLQAEIGVLLQRCQQARALQIGVSVQAAQTIIGEAIEEVKPDAHPYVSVPQVEFAVPKF